MLRRITRDPGVSPGSLRDVARELLSAADRVDLGLILALVLALLAALPFLTRASLPHQTDAELHVYRTAELGRIVRQGILYPRWASNFYLGYGYPIFNYYAPCTYHLGTWLAAIIPGAGVVAGTKMVFVFGLMLASVGAYLLGRDIFEPAGGVLAAASFTLSPYVLFIDPHARGDLAEHFAICLLPLTFYFVRRLMTTPKPGPLAGTVLTLAVLVFSHNLLGLVASFLLLFYWVWRLLLGPRQSQLLWVLLAFSLAGGLIAFFWVPALVERGAVRLDVIGPGHFDFREHFLTVRDLLAPSRRLDWGATGPRYRHNLGIVQWVLAVPAGAVLLRSVLKGRDGEASWDVGYFVAGAVGLIFLMISPSTVVWETIPAMAYLQFPWRLLGSANFMLAVCVAGAVALLPDRPWRRMVLAGGLVTLLAGALPLLYPPPWPADFGPTTAPAVLQWERESQALGTTSTGDFLPSTVEVIPSPAETLVESYEKGDRVDKVNRATLPDGAEVRILSHGPSHDRFLVKSPESFILRLYTFHFPGWQAYVDGDKVEIEIGHPEGFITVRVPEGEHTVLVRFENTPVRTVGWFLAGGALFLLMVTLALRGRVMSRDPGVTPDKLARSDGLWLGAALVALIVAKLALVDPLGLMHLHSPPGQALPAQHKERASFEGKIELLGYDLPHQRVKPGGTVPVVLYWRALTPLERNYQSFVHVAQPLDTVWGQEDHLNPGALPTTRWPVDEYVWDEYKIRVRPGTPPGEYQVNVGLYLQSEGYRLRRHDSYEQPQEDSLVVGSITVTE